MAKNQQIKQWKQVVIALQQSDLNVTVYCRKQDINYSLSHHENKANPLKILVLHRIQNFS